MSKIAFDIRTTHLTGVYRYAVSLLRQVIDLAGTAGHAVRVLHWPESRQPLPGSLREQGERVGIEFVPVEDDWRFLRDSPWLCRWLKVEGIELYYSAHYLVDPALPIPFVYTIHDLIRLKYPHLSYNDQAFIDKFGVDEFERMRDQLHAWREQVPAVNGAAQSVFHAYFLAVNRRLAVRSWHINAVSHATKSDIERILRVPADKISVIPNATNPVVFHARSTGETEGVLARFGLDSPYCLFVGLTHKHKRLPWLVEVLAQVRSRLTDGARLAIVGGHCDLDLSASGFADALIFTGAVSDRELAALYSRANALVVSSVEEGFCLPALEALACGTEVVVPDIRALREVAGDSGHFYGTWDRNRLGELLVQAYGDRLPHRAHTFVNPYSWRKSASRLCDLFSRIAGAADRGSASNAEPDAALPLPEWIEHAGKVL